MANTNNLAALDWVKKEVVVTLNQASYFLEAYLSDSSSRDSLLKCKSSFTQIFGVFQIVELEGPAEFAKALVALVDMLIEEKLSRQKVPRAVAIILKSINELPQYLDLLRELGSDQPLIILPLVNQLRQLSGNECLAASEFFSPDLGVEIFDSLKEELQRLLQQKKFKPLCKKLKQATQSVLVGFSKKRSIQSYLKQISQSLAALQALTGESDLAYIWQTFGLVFSGVQDKHIREPADLKRVFLEFDHLFKNLVQNEIEKSVPDLICLLKRCLYLVAKYLRDAGKAVEVLQHFSVTLDQVDSQWLDAQRAKLKRPNDQAFSAVIASASDELADIKERLDLISRQESREPAELKVMFDSLNQIKNIVDVLNLPVPKKLLEKQIKRYEFNKNQDILSEAWLVDLANVILYVESALGCLLPPGAEYFDLNPEARILIAQKQMIRSCQQELEVCKESFITYVQSDLDTKALTRAVDGLLAIQSNLVLLEKIDIAEIAGRLGAFFYQSLIRQKSVLDAQGLELLADVVAAIDCHLDQLLDVSACTNDFLLIAQTKLALLGVPEVAVPFMKPLHTPTVLESTADIDALAREQTAVDIHERRQASSASDAINPAAQTHAEEQPSKSSEADSASETDEGEIDEIVDIFMEEAEEIIEALNQNLVILKEQTNDFEALQSVRRGFHTLKGSGRMVQADSVSELAWQMERLLNYHLDNRKTFEPLIVGLLDQVVQRLPKMLADFSSKCEQQTHVFSVLTSWVDEILSGTSIGNLVAPDQILDTTQALPLEDAFAEEKSVVNLSQDQGFIKVFISETKAHLAEVQSYLEASEGELNRPFSPDLLRVLHTLKGSAKMAEVEGISEIASKMEPLIKGLSQAGIFLDGQTQVLLEQLLDIAQSVIDNLSDGKSSAVLEEGLLNQQADFLHLIEKIRESYEEQLLAAENKSVVGSAEKTWFSQSIEAFETLADHAEFMRVEDGSSVREQVVEALAQLSYSASSLELWSYVQIADLLKDFYQQFHLNVRLKNEQILIVSHAHQFLIDVADAVALGQSPPDIETCLASLEALMASLSHPVETDAHGGLESNIELSVMAELAGTADADELTAIFLQEVSEILEGTRQNLKRLDQTQDQQMLLEEFARDYHLLNGASKLAEVDAIGDLAVQLEILCEMLIDKKIPATETVVNILVEAQAAFEKATLSLKSNQFLADSTALIEKVNALQLKLLQIDAAQNQNIQTSVHLDVTKENQTAPQSSIAAESTPASTNGLLQQLQQSESVSLAGLDLEIVDIFVEEAQEILDGMSIALECIVESALTKDQDEIKRLVHTLKGGARLAGFEILGTALHALETDFLSENNAAWDKTKVNALFQYHDVVNAYVELILVAQENLNNAGAVSQQSITQAVLDPPMLDARAQKNDVPQGHQSEPVGSELSDDEVTLKQEALHADPEIMPIFLEEATELVDDIDAALSAWDQEPGSNEYQEALQRSLHTLKGGARLAGLNRLGHLGHEFETFLAETNVSNTQLLLKRIHEKYDTLVAAVEATRKFASDVEAEEIVPSAVVTVDESAQLESVSKEDRHQQSVSPPEFVAKHNVKKINSQEMIRVGSDLLERLVNMAGEASIARGRVEQEVNDYRYVLDDMHMAVERMREKIRQMEGELETHILASQDYGVRFNHQLAEFAGENDDDFDPLEMDHYSSLHHLARSLSESASDVADLRDTLKDRMRSTESLLMLQARINTELQEGLMQTRMVPFSRLSPKLKRVVRQVSGELGKEVELQIVNDEGELDRNVLERMVAPLEHMLRNSVDHGIESPQQRLKAGKSPQGKITLNLSREGNEVVLRLSDDGAGIDLKRVKARAIKNKLMTKDAKLSDNEILQFIFRSGFSTAVSVTQISGRGVGMDVVHSEIKQLGGNLKISSVAGRGSEFIIRLPFTVAVSRALMVKIADDYYAIPLSHIEGLVRINSHELKHFYQGSERYFKYMGKEYEVRYLGGFVHNQQEPDLNGQSKPVPLLLARNTDRSVAIHVDSLVGSREIVVKTVGPQLSNVAGLSGATILGDGSVVIILDLNALIRADIAVRRSGLHEQQAVIVEAPSQVAHVFTIMVVDDSVTVRRVTTRLLERNGYQVVTAKDGVDAVTKLRDTCPSLVLLDIEMPRMDGFEVATHIRHDANLKNLPIIMISSRTGDKHKERASDIGVNSFVGKPYQETQLLAEINALLGEPTLKT